MSHCTRCGAPVPAGAAFCAACGQATGAPPARRSSAALIVTIVVAVGLFVVVIGGIIAAIAIPNLLNAVDRGKQKRTMTDIRGAATAVEQFSIDNDRYPAVSSIEQLGPLVEPLYIRTLVRQDAWGYELRYQCLALDPEGACVSYAIASPGKDGLFERGDLGDYSPGETTRFDDDIVYADGSFVRYPRGHQE